MISYKKALKIIKKGKISFKSEKISSEQSVGRICSENIYSPCNYPSANNTAFDGFAINSNETINLKKNKSKKFEILKVIAAGDNPNIKKVKKFSAVEVRTGALVIKPFNTVIPIEKAIFFPSKKNPKYIILDKKIKKNQHIRFLGSDYKKGDKVISKGQLIEPKHILAFKTLGINKVLVKKIFKIIFYTTGNEISNKKNIPVWKVRNSNSYYLKSYLKNFPVNFEEKRILRDNDKRKFYQEMKAHLKNNTDIIITSGAVSAGKFDFIPKEIKKFKPIIFFKGSLIRPGKPILFAKLKKGKAFFGLPGNPISSAACFRFFVYPFIRCSLGMDDEKYIKAKLIQKYVKDRNITRFVKGYILHNLKGHSEFKILKGQESFRISPLTKSNAWGVFEDKKSIFKKGDLISCFSA